MDNSYLRTMRQALQPSVRKTKETCLALSCRLWAVVLLLSSVSFNGMAQTFSEPMSDAGVTVVDRELVSAYTSRGGFSNDASGTNQGTLTYSGSARLATLGVTGAYPNASSGPAVFFGPATTGGPQTLPQNFNTSGINTTGLGRIQVTFGLYTYQGSKPSSSDFLVQYSANGGGFTTMSYGRTTSNTSTTGFVWNLYTVTTLVPNVNSLTLNFVRTAAATGVTGNNKEFRLDDVVLSAPKIVQVSTSALIFPTTAVNATSPSQSFTLTGYNLTDDVIVAAPAGYLVGIDGGAFASTATIGPEADGTVSTSVDVVFAPTSNEAPNPPSTVNGFVVVSSQGATNTTVQVTGQAIPAIPILTASEDSLSFGLQTVGTNSAPQSFQLEGRDLTSNVTVSTPAGFEIRTGNAAFSPNPITLYLVNGAVSATIDVRFVPGTTGAITGTVTATSTGVDAVEVAVDGSGDAAPSTPVINATPMTVAFGIVTNSGSAQAENFTVSGTSLTAPLTLTPSNANIEIRNATAGGSFGTSVSITPNASSNVTNQIIEVRLVATVPINTFTGSILLQSTDATDVVVNVTANNPSGAISDISLTNARLREFSTAPGVASDIQSYNVSADNLLQNLTITAPLFFQISRTAGAAGFASLGTTTGNTIVLTPTSGNADPNLNGDVDLTTIYVRYYPSGAQTNRGQVVSNSSAPARTQFVSVNGSSEPEVLVLGGFAPVVNQVKFTKSGIQQLTVVAARVRNTLTIRVPQDPESPTTASPLNPSRTPQFEISLTGNANDFSTQVSFTPDANDSIARRPLYVRYAPTRVGSALADLLFRTVDINGNAEAAAPRVRLQGNALAIEPSRQSAGTVTRSADRTSVVIVFTQENTTAFPGNPEAAGFGQNRLIIASTSNTLGVGFFPQDAASYDPGNNRYGDGSMINGNYVVFASSAPTATITNLNPNVNYYFFGFEYNNDQVGGAENYKTPNLPINIQLPLPVELISFTAQLRGNKVNLNWVTASETNNQGFEVQRSHNGQQFSPVLFKDGRGTTTARTTYEAVDEQPLAGLSYYRLKQIDRDGTFAYSPVVIVKNALLTEASFYPNPTSGKLAISLPQAQTTEALQVRITDLTGRVLRTQTLTATGEVDLGELKAGTYLVTVGAGNQQITRKVVKN